MSTDRLPDWFRKNEWFMRIDNLFVASFSSASKDYYLELACLPEETCDGKYRVFYTHNETKISITAELDTPDSEGNDVLQMIYGGRWIGPEG